MELLLHQWGDWPELYRNTDKTEATEIVIIDSQMNYRGKLDTYRLNPMDAIKSSLSPIVPAVVHSIPLYFVSPSVGLGRFIDFMGFYRQFPAGKVESGNV